MTSALSQLISDLDRIEILLNLERTHCGSRVRVTMQSLSDALRGSALILLVAAFESYLKELFEEHLTVFARSTPALALSSFPDKMQIMNIFGNIRYMLQAPRHTRLPKDVSSIPSIRSICGSLSAGTVVLDVFTETWSNPGPETVKEMFSNVGIQNLFPAIHSAFVRNWTQPIHANFIKETLQTIIDRRNDVAHSMRALTISRRDMRMYLKFIEILARILNVELANHISTLSP